MTDDNQSAVQALPPEEFDVRGCRGAEGMPGNYVLGMIDTGPVAPAMTVDRARELLDAAVTALQTLMAIEAPTLSLRYAIQSAMSADAHVAAHKATMSRAYPVPAARTTPPCSPACSAATTRRTPSWRPPPPPSAARPESEPMSLRWTDHEHEILDRVYPTGGSRGVHELLPSRSMEAIKVQAHFRMLRFADRRSWTDAERDIVFANYPTLGAKRTAELLPGRGHQDVASYANAHGVFRIRRVA